CAADHRPGVFLSGGLDSTLLTALAARQRSEKLRTFTIQFQEQASFDYQHSLIVRSDDTPHAASAAPAIGAEHSIITVARARLARDLRAVGQINDGLPAWEQELAQHHLARGAARAGLRCVLVGDAADETHYGYPFLLDAAATRSPRHLLSRFSFAPLTR